MKRLILTTLLAFAFGIGLSLLTATSSMAVHKGAGALTCGACHTMHSSQGGTSVSSDPNTILSMGDGSAAPAGSGSFVLLRTAVSGRENLHNFCLQCHSEQGAAGNTTQNLGTAFETKPPKVHSDTLWDGNNFANGVGGGGKFIGTYTPGSYVPPSSDDPAQLGTTALGKQHSIGASEFTVSKSTPPGNSITGTSLGVTIKALSCTSCHDPHGTDLTNDNINKYRNLKAGAFMTANLAQNPWSNMGTFGDLATSYVGGVAGSATGGSDPTLVSNIWPVINAAGTTQNSYKTKNVIITLGGNNINAAVDGNANNVGFSAFCAQCHGAWHEGVTTNANISGDDWKRHPVNNSLKAGTPNSGAGVNIVDFTHYNNTGTGSSAAPYGTTIGTKLPAATPVGETTYYATDGATAKVFCLSCHFSHGSIYNDILRWNYTSTVLVGSQIGNAIASNVGCQQCHNR